VMSYYILGPKCWWSLRAKKQPQRRTLFPGASQPLQIPSVPVNPGFPSQMQSSQGVNMHEISLSNMISIIVALRSVGCFEVYKPQAVYELPSQCQYESWKDAREQSDRTVICWNSKFPKELPEAVSSQTSGRTTVHV
jgi:hypothetical protein